MRLPFGEKNRLRNEIEDALGSEEPLTAVFALTCLAALDSASAAGYMNRIAREMQSTPRVLWLNRSRAFRGAVSRSYHLSSDSTRKERLLESAKSLIALGPAGHTCLGVLSFVPNGFVREQAIRLMAQAAPLTSIPFLLIGCMDHVENVRTASAETLAGLISPDNAFPLVENIELVVALRRSERGVPPDLLAGIERLLQHENAVPALLELASKTTGRLNELLSMQLLSRPTPPVDFVLQSVRSKYRNVRLRAVEALSYSAVPNLEQRLLKIIVKDGSVAVKERAIVHLSRLNPSAAEDSIRWSLLHKSSVMRYTARRLLELTSDAAAAVYRPRVKDPSLNVRCAAIVGLAETGTRLDAALIQPLLSDENPRLRKAAIRALRILAPDDNAAAIFSLVRDPVAGVSSAARRAIAGLSASINSDALLQAWKTAQHDHVRPQLVRLVQKLPKWEKLRILLTLVASSNPPLRETVLQMLVAWDERFNIGSTAVPLELKEELRSLLQQNADVLKQIKSSKISSLHHSLQLVIG